MNTIRETSTVKSTRQEFANGKTMKMGAKFGRKYRRKGIQFRKNIIDDSTSRATFTGDKVRIIGYLKWDETNKQFRLNKEFRHFCKVHHIDIQPIAGEMEVMAFTGTGESITLLAHSSYLRKWEYSHSASVPPIHDAPKRSKLSGEAQAKLGAAMADGYSMTYAPSLIKTDKGIIRRRMVEQRKRYRELNKTNPVIRDICKFMACLLHNSTDSAQTKYCGEYVYNNIDKINSIPAESLPASITKEFLSSVVRLSADSDDMPAFRRDLNAIIQWETDNLNARNVSELCLIRSVISAPEYYVNEMMRIDGTYATQSADDKTVDFSKYKAY